MPKIKVLGSQLLQININLNVFKQIFCWKFSLLEQSLEVLKSSGSCNRNSSSSYVNYLKEWLHRYKHDKTSYDWAEIEARASHFRLQQYINEPTKILAESSCSIHLIFTLNQSLEILKCETHLSCKPNCHYQIAYAKFHLKLYYPLQYKRDTWDFQQ